MDDFIVTDVSISEKTLHLKLKEIRDVPPDEDFIDWRMVIPLEGEKND